MALMAETVVKVTKDIKVRISTFELAYASFSCSIKLFTIYLKGLPGSPGPVGFPGQRGPAGQDGLNGEIGPRGTPVFIEALKKLTRFNFLGSEKVIALYFLGICW